MSSPDRNSRGHSPIPAEAEEAVDENPVPDAGARLARLAHSAQAAATI